MEETSEEKITRLEKKVADLELCLNDIKSAHVDIIDGHEIVNAGDVQQAQAILSLASVGAVSCQSVAISLGAARRRGWKQGREEIAQFIESGANGHSARADIAIAVRHFKK